VASGLVDDADIDALFTALTSAKAADYHWVTSPFMLELVLRTPVE
jgi:hypothetical protein